MAKFYGKIGFQQQVEVRPGIWQPVVEEREYIGDIHRNSRRFSSVADKVNEDINMSNEISIIADPFALNNFSQMLYVEYFGQLFRISDVEVLYPRLKFSLGGVYNGPTAKDAGCPYGCNESSGR